MIRVLVVDDSAFMRKAISMMLETDPGIRVVATARDGRDAVDKARHLEPDVITMDVEMPRMNGIDAVRHIMQERPCPILMISAQTQHGAQSTMEALEAGAVDVISKDLSHVSLEIVKLQDALVERVRVLAGGARPAPRPARRTAAGKGPLESLGLQPEVVVISTSTGGPLALQTMIPSLPADYPLPVVVVQHMPPFFTRYLAERLNAQSEIAVVEATAGMRLRPGLVLVAPGGSHLTLRQSVVGVTVGTPNGGADSLHRPSADVTLNSAALAFGSGVLAVILTGMGNDGLQGARAVRNAGGAVVAQSEESCVVYGMPRAVVEAGLANAILPLGRIPGLLSEVAADSSTVENAI